MYAAILIELKEICNIFLDIKGQNLTNTINHILLTEARQIKDPSFDMSNHPNINSLYAVFFFFIKFNHKTMGT